MLYPQTKKLLKDTRKHIVNYCTKTPAITEEKERSAELDFFISRVGAKCVYLPQNSLLLIHVN